MIKPWYMFTFISLIFFGLWGFLGAKTSAEVCAKSATFYSALGTFIVAISCILFMDFEPGFNTKGLTYGVLTGMATGLGTLFFIGALRQGPAIPIVTITALYPLVSTVLMVVFLNHSITLKQAIGILLSLFAIVLLS